MKSRPLIQRRAASLTVLKAAVNEAEAVRVVTVVETLDGGLGRLGNVEGRSGPVEEFVEGF